MKSNHEHIIPSRCPCRPYFCIYPKSNTEYSERVERGGDGDDPRRVALRSPRRVDGLGGRWTGSVHLGSTRVDFSAGLLRIDRAMATWWPGQKQCFKA
ncbi:hypothetical protein MGN70_000677 [Eutypa lata]|nr:hypothetical protein MGN70_000677 [Eutypa lata]